MTTNGNNGQHLTVAEHNQLQVNNFRQELSRQTKALKAMLPSHIEVDKFQRAAVTAVSNNPDLLNADRQSLFNSLTRCAGDGLLPDNREATVQIYKTKVDNNWIKKAQYMPMVYGVIKRMRNSGEVSTVEAHIVYKNDMFDFELGDNPKLYHKPSLDGDRGEAVLVYCIVNFKDGAKYREIMTVNDVNKARDKSPGYKNYKGDINKNSPWVQWWDEMAKKTVIHRAAKRLPASSDLEKFMDYDMRVTLNPESVADEPVETAPRKSKILDNVEEMSASEEVIENPPQGEGAQESPKETADNPEEVFPGDIPEGVTIEQYYEQEYGQG